MTTTSDSRRVGRLIIYCLLAVASLYAFQGVIVRLRLSQLAASTLLLSPVSESCNDQNCTMQWQFTPEQQYVILGQILRSHRVVDTLLGQDVLPVTQVRGTSSDPWLRLHVYRVTPHRVYTLIATKPTSTRLDYFIGIMPRSANHDGVLSIPDIGPLATALSSTVSIFVLILVLVAANIGLGSANSINDNQKRMMTLSCSALILAAVTFVSSGVIDTLLPEGNFRNRILRSMLVLSCLLPIAAHPLVMKGRYFALKLAMSIISIGALALLSWPLLKVGAYWSVTLAAVSLLGGCYFALTGQLLAAFFWLLGIIDAMKIAGVIRFYDYPPIYFFNFFSILSLVIAAGHAGGFSTIAMASVAYHRFKRDLLISQIKHALDGSESRDSSAKIYQLKAVLAGISDLTHASRVSVTVNLPLGRPIIQTYDRDVNDVTVHDDGTIPGAVTLRTLIYGDTAIFQSFRDYRKKLNIATNPNLDDARYFCAVPLIVDGSIIGSITFTKFNDDNIEKIIKIPDAFAESRDNINLIASTLSQSLSSLMIRDLHSSAATSKSLHQAIHREIAVCTNPEDFLNRFAACIADSLGASVMIHSASEYQGQAVAHARINSDAWNFLKENSLNLRPDSSSHFGPTVVAFQEKKSIYVKEVNEISHRLHYKTRLLFEVMNAKTLAAIPLTSSERAFVVTIVMSREQPLGDPSMVPVIESTEALFIAAMEVVSQRTSVIALGELTNRLIGDEGVRRKIVAAAKDRLLPTTIGSAKTSFLLLFDLAGSSDISQDTEVKARAYGDFYDAVNGKSQELLNGSIRKTIGDAVIITWDGSDIDPSTATDFLGKLEFLTQYADHKAKSIGCKGARAILHHGSYFLGLVGTKTFGQIDVIGSGIDEVCKMEGIMKLLSVDGHPVKLAISEIAASKLSSITTIDYVTRKYAQLEMPPPAKMRISFANTLSSKREDDHHVA